MNIEEERKAFEAAFLKNRMDYAQASGLSVEVMRQTVLRSIEQGLIPKAMFEIWLAAKAHAEEMHKPKCTIEQMFPINVKIWNVIDSFGDRVAWSNESKEDAVQWAKENGYRVIE